MKRFLAPTIIALICLILTGCSAMREISGQETLRDEAVAKAPSLNSSNSSTKTDPPKEIGPKEVIPTDKSTVVAKRFVENLIRGDSAAARDDCAPSLDYNKVVESFDHTSSSIGGFVELGSVSETTREASGISTPIVMVLAAFEDESIMFSLEFDSGRVANVWLDRYGGY